MIRLAEVFELIKSAEYSTYAPRPATIPVIAVTHDATPTATM